MITTSKKISSHFHSNEFKCKCGCGRIYIDEGLVNKLEQLFAKLNASKCIISSGYRCSKHDKNVGGNGYGQHTKGYAADCVYYDKNGKIIPSKIVVCVAYDIGLFKGMANINNNYQHLDVRTTGTYRGDETRGNSSYWTNPYSYYGVSKADVCKYTGETTATSAVTSGNHYQSHGVNTKWYPNVIIGDDNYAGKFKVPMDALYIDDLEYCVQINGNRWLPMVKGRSDYAGILRQNITGVAIKGNVMYRVHNMNKNYWLGWIDGNNTNTDDREKGYAGNESIIDAVQIKRK